VKIALVSPRYLPFPGGVERHVSEIAERMVAAGHTVEVLTQEPDPDLPRVDRIEGVTVRRFPVLLPPPAYALAPGLPLFLRTGHFDVVHIHNYHALSAPLAAAATSAPVVFTPHYHGTGHRPLGKLLHQPYRLVPGRYLFHRARAVICVSGVEAASVRRDFPSAASQVTVIPNGVDVEAIRSAFPLPMPGRMILTGGRLLAYKGVDRLIDALSLLPPAFHVMVTGEGPERERWERLASTLGVSHRVTFTGVVPREHLYRLLRTADVYASLSEAEAYGMAVAEALAAGAGVLASDIPAHREVIGDGRDRVRLTPAQASREEVASAIEALANGPRPVRLVPTWEDVTQRTLRVYERVARGVV
jgi:glycosyltransferase involved in cell wall biosynthesis